MHVANINLLIVATNDRDQINNIYTIYIYISIEAGICRDYINYYKEFKCGSIITHFLNASRVLDDKNIINVSVKKYCNAYIVLGHG